MRTMYSAETWHIGPSICPRCHKLSDGLCVAGEEKNKAVFILPCGHLDARFTPKPGVSAVLSNEEMAMAFLMME